MASQDATRWWYAAEALVAASVVAMPVALGGAAHWSLPLLVGSAMLAMVCWLIGAIRHRRRATWHRLLWLPGALALVALLSVVPLPPGLQALLTPANAELREFALVPLGLDRWRPVTADVPATLRALARVLALGSLVFVSLQLGRVPGPRARLARVLALSGALVAVVGVGHLLAGAQSLFGLHHFVGNLPLLSFFGNTNHLAAYLAFTATVALAVALDAPSREQAIGWGMVALVIGVAVFLSLSRGGIAFFVCTWAAVGALLLVRRQGGVRGAVPWLVIGATALAALALVFEPLLDKVETVSSLDKLKHTKVELWPMFWDGARAWARTGMGLGAFELAFTRHQTAQLDVTFTHPENLVLQWLSELGVPLTAAFVAGVLVVAVGVVRQARGALFEQVLLVGILGAGLHDIFDFALELNALPPAVVVALGLAAAREPPGAPEPRRSMARRAGLVGAVALGAAAFAAVFLGPPHHQSEEALGALITRQAPDDEVRAAALKAIDRHPSDWVLYAQVANQLSPERTPRETLAWVNRVLFLRPREPSAHVSAGRALLVLRQPTQALLEFKAAWLLGDESSMELGLALAAKYGLWDRLLVETPGLLTRLWEHTRASKRPADGRALLDAVFLLPPSSAVLEEAKVLEVWQAELSSDVGAVLARLDELPPELQARVPLVILRARSLAASGRAPEAIAQLDAHARRAPAEVGFSTTLADLLAKDGRPAEARAAIARVQPFATTARLRAELYLIEANLWMQEERWGRALDSLQTAARIEPHRPDLHYRLAEVYERMGSLHSALDEVRKGRLLDTPEGAKARDSWVERLEAAMSQVAQP